MAYHLAVEAAEIEYTDVAAVSSYVFDYLGSFQLAQGKFVLIPSVFAYKLDECVYYECVVLGRYCEGSVRRRSRLVLAFEKLSLLDYLPRIRQEFCPFLG